MPINLILWLQCVKHELWCHPVCVDHMHVHTVCTRSTCSACTSSVVARGAGMWVRGDITVYIWQGTKQVSTLKVDVNWWNCVEAKDMWMQCFSKGACSCGPLSYTMTRIPEDGTSCPNWYCPCAGQQHTLGYVGGIWESSAQVPTSETRAERIYLYRWFFLAIVAKLVLRGCLWTVQC